MKSKLFLLAVVFFAAIPMAFSQGMQGGDRGGISVKNMCTLVPTVQLNINDAESIKIFFTKDMEKIDVRIENVYGKVVYSKDMDTSADNNLDINISKFAIGSYTITIKDSDGKVIRTGYFLIE